MPDSFVGEIRFDSVPPAYLVMSRQLGMHFSQFEADPVVAGGSQIDMHVAPAAFKKWISDCLDSIWRPAAT
jgi:alpha-galactosidase